MPSNIPATTIRIDPEVKKEATAILDELGLSMSTAVNAFLRALVRDEGQDAGARRGDGEIAGRPACQSWSNRAKQNGDAPQGVSPAAGRKGTSLSADWLH